MNKTAATILPAGPQQLLRGLDVRRIRFGDESARGRLESLLAGAGATGMQWTVVKHSISRTVYRWAEGNGAGSLYLKHFHSPAMVHRLQRRLGASDAMCEMRFSEYLARHGVPVPTVLAAYCHGGAEWLIADGVEPAARADQWHPVELARGNHGAIRAATIALAELVGRMHAVGVLHRDLHCGNVLVRRPAADRPALVLTDLHRMCRRRQLSRRNRSANLAQLLHDRRLWTTRTQQLRFLRHYLRASGAEGSLRGWVRMIEPLARRHSRRLYAQRDRRVFSNNRYFARIGVGGYRAHAVLASKRHVPGSPAAEMTFTPNHWAEALADPEALLDAPGGQIVKDSPSSLVVRRKLRVGPAEIDVYVKRTRRKRAVRWLWDLFRRSRALRAFSLGHALLARHIYTALPLAAMEKRRCRLLLDSILITEAVNPGRAPAASGTPVAGNRTPIHLDKFLASYLGVAGTAEALLPNERHRLAQQVLWQLGRLLRRLHEEGFSHRDLKASNLLVHWTGRPESGPELILVDLDGARRARRVTARQEFRGLMRLNVSLLECPSANHAGRLRMLLGYLRSPGTGRINFKPYWRVLQQWSDKKIRQQIASRQRRQKARRRSSP